MYCCIKQWLIVHRHVKTGKLAASWGLSRSTVKNWRHRLKVGDLPCERKPECRMAFAGIRIVTCKAA